MSSIIVPLQVLGIGIVISYGIAMLMYVLLFCIQFFHKEDKQSS